MLNYGLARLSFFIYLTLLIFFQATNIAYSDADTSPYEFVENENGLFVIDGGNKDKNKKLIDLYRSLGYKEEEIDYKEDNEKLLELEKNQNYYVIKNNRNDKSSLPTKYPITPFLTKYNEEIYPRNNPDFTINRNNNLYRKTGSALFAAGDKLHIIGIVTDVYGVPITNAVIDIWQTNVYGEYDYLLNKIFPEQKALIDPNFNSTGRAITNNLGEFNFLTIFPAPYKYKDRTSLINVQVKHPDFGTIYTEMFFDKNPKNEKDPYFSKLTPTNQKLLTAYFIKPHPMSPTNSKIAIFHIVLDGKSFYKKF